MHLIRMGNIIINLEQIVSIEVETEEEELEARVFFSDTRAGLHTLTMSGAEAESFLRYLVENNLIMGQIEDVSFEIPEPQPRPKRAWWQF